MKVPKVPKVNVFTTQLLSSFVVPERPYEFMKLPDNTNHTMTKENTKCQ